MKFFSFLEATNLFKSLPTWERGLKSELGLKQNTSILVAPYVGAWIEIYKNNMDNDQIMSLPTWERGLKLKNVKEKQLN